MPEIETVFQSIYDENKAIHRVNIKSAAPITASQKERLQHGLEKVLEGKVIIGYDLNPDMISGIQLEHGDIQINNALKNKIDQLTDDMKGIF